MRVLVPSAAFVEAYQHVGGINRVVDANHEHVVLEVSMLRAWDHNPVTGTRNSVSLNASAIVQILDNRLVDKYNFGHVLAPLKWPRALSGVASSCILFR
jgi:hypothetical protein